MTTLIYDGSFEGFLSAVFSVYELRLQEVRIIRTGQTPPDMFSDQVSVATNTWHAERVWKGLTKKLKPAGAAKIFRVYLSELDDMEHWMLGYIQHAFASKQNISADFGNPFVLKVDQLDKMIGRERHRMEAFVRFQLIEGDVYYASVEPDFNVLPLLISHFKKRYADQQWIIYDIRRGYGIHYNLQKVDFMNLNFLEKYRFGNQVAGAWKEGEEFYQVLWRDYFKSVNIETRKNTRLHVRHVPKRYWKYLTEKQPG
ncbi:MAG: TIGR03915 family putative DNA repair protein [Mucilaginibacter polytrichastri]|nr:TIGR03915 family putative DNA repair protein [Mucilaginibacter polytrichastri]